MKTKIIAGLALVVGVSAFAQEYDDMYFRSKDREKAQKVSNNSYSSNYENFKKKHFDEATELDEYNNVNPTDSYSARNINPEFIARSNSEQASEDETNYFVENYTPVQSFSSNNSAFYNNNWNNRWNNPYQWGMYGSSFYSPLYSPYYGWNDPWSNPYWCANGFNSGLTFGSSLYWGNSWNYGWNYGAGYTWGNPYGNLWGPSFYSPYYRPYTTIVVVGERSRPNYGKRPSHNSAGVGDAANRYNRTSSSVNNGDARGRMSNRGTDEYYVRPSRRTYTDSNSSSYNRSSNSSNSYRINNNNSEFNRDSRSTGFSSPSRSSGSSMMGSPSRGSSSGMSMPSRSSGSSGGSSSGSRRGGN